MIDRSRGGLGSKIHVAVDGNGAPLAAYSSAGTRSMLAARGLKAAVPQKIRQIASRKEKGAPAEAARPAAVLTGPHSITAKHIYSQSQELDATRAAVYSHR